MTKPTWQTDDGSVKLWRGDCRALMASMESGSVDAVVTDPKLFDPPLPQQRDLID